jgi:hypothetical protein
MRRVLPDPDVLQRSLQSMVRRVQRTSDGDIHVLWAFEYLLNLLIVALVEIVKQKTWVTIRICWDSKLRQKFTDALVRNVSWRNPLARLRTFQKCPNHLAKRFQLATDSLLDYIDADTVLWRCDIPVLSLA